MVKMKKIQKEKTSGPSPEVMHAAKLRRKAGINVIKNISRDYFSQEMIPMSTLMKKQM